MEGSGKACWNGKEMALPARLEELHEAGRLKLAARPLGSLSFPHEELDERKRLFVGPGHADCCQLAEDDGQV